jgi:hypothetical protein
MEATAAEKLRQKNLGPKDGETDFSVLNFYVSFRPGIFPLSANVRFVRLSFQ